MWLFSISTHKYGKKIAIFTYHDYYGCMKATLELVDSLHREIKTRARSEDKTFRAKVEELLTLGLQAERETNKKRKPFKLNIPKTSGKLLVDLLDKEAMSRLEDEKFYRLFGKQ